MNKKKLTLFILLAAFALSLLYAYWTTPRVERVAERGSRVLGPGRAAPAPAGEPEGLRLDLLEKKKERFPGVGRDIFSLKERRPPPPKPKVVKAPPPPPPPVVRPRPALPVPVVKALARFTFLGFLQKGSEKTVFLASGTDLFVVKKGERFGKKKEFFVTDITAEAMTIRQGDDPRVITVRLVEKAPLAPRRGNF